MDGSVVVVIQPAAESRTLAQNRLMWMWFGEIASETGYSKQKVHDLMCKEFLGSRIEVDLNGEEFEVLNTTRGLKVKEFTVFLEEVDAWASDFGILLSRPQDVYYQAIGIS